MLPYVGFLFRCYSTPETREGQAIALPYGRNGRFVMEIFLPRDAATLRRWERELKGVDFFAGEQGGNDRFDLSAEQAREMRIVLPRFEARFDEFFFFSGTTLN